MDNKTLDDRTTAPAEVAASEKITPRAIFATVFATIFYGLAMAIMVSMAWVIVEEVQARTEFMQILIKTTNSSIIALAVFELANVINKEYGVRKREQNVLFMLRRTLPRFIGTVSVALSLEGLIMVIKYSQMDLAGNLHYPVAIICSAALLLTSLGVFLKLAPSGE